jgi:hypothetical protein
MLYELVALRCHWQPFLILQSFLAPRRLAVRCVAGVVDLVIDQ